MKPKSNKGRRTPYKEPSSLGKLVPGVLRGIRPRGLKRLQAVWADVVGEVAASRTRLVAFEQGVLCVDVASAALKHDLSTFRREEILEGLRSKLPGALVQAVRYRVSSLS